MRPGLFWFLMLWVVTPAIAYHELGWFGVVLVPVFYAAGIVVVRWLFSAGQP